MPRLDQTNRLTVTHISPKGTFVDGREWGLLYLRDAPESIKKGDQVTAFLYRDANDQVCATASSSLAKIGECAYLRVVSTNDVGAFLDCGLPKDLLLPYSEQAYPVREGGSYVVYVYQDNSQRMVATTLLHQHLSEQADGLKVGEAVDLLIAAKSDLGFKAVINGQQLGLIYHGDLSQPLRFGMKMKGWVKGIRDDGKIDLTINRLDKDTRDQLEARILKELSLAGGRMDLSDKSPPETIFRIFKVSKKNFKRALSSLYKQRLILISPTYIELVQK